LAPRKSLSHRSPRQKAFEVNGAKTNRECQVRAAKGKGDWGIVKCEECDISVCRGATNHLKLNGAAHFKRQRQQRLPNRWRFELIYKEKKKKIENRRKSREPAPKSRAGITKPKASKHAPSTRTPPNTHPLR